MNIHLLPPPVDLIVLEHRQGALCCVSWTGRRPWPSHEPWVERPWRRRRRVDDSRGPIERRRRWPRRDHFHKVEVTDAKAARQHKIISYSSMFFLMKMGTGWRPFSSIAFLHDVMSGP